MQLNNQQFSKIKKAAGNFTSILFRLRLKAKQINQSKSAKAKKQTRIKEIEDEYNQLPMIYRKDLRKDFGEKDFERFDKSFQEKISARMSYRSNIRKQLLFTGFSTVSYDSVSGEIIGYSKTPNDGTDCDSEENTDCVGTSVYAVLSSDREGVLDSDSSEDCNSDSEVFLYSSGSLPEASYCVNGYHGYDDSSFCSFQGGGSVFTSEDCLTTPPAPNVATITFQPIAQNNLPIDEINGGLRIFPDDNSPMENANRQTIRVSASISEARAGQMVYFRSFDIDDPSTDLTIDPNGNLGDDNNGSVNNLKEGQLLIPAGSGGC